MGEAGINRRPVIGRVPTQTFLISNNYVSLLIFTVPIFCLRMLNGKDDEEGTSRLWPILEFFQASKLGNSSRLPALAGFSPLSGVVLLCVICLFLVLWSAAKAQGENEHLRTASHQVSFYFSLCTDSPDPSIPLFLSYTGLIVPKVKSKAIKLAICVKKSLSKILVRRTCKS